MKPEQIISQQDIGKSSSSLDILKKKKSYYNSLSLDELLTQLETLKEKCKSIDIFLDQEKSKPTVTPAEKKLFKSVLRERGHLSDEITKMNLIIKKKTIDLNRISYSEIDEFMESVFQMTLKTFSHDLSYFDVYIDECFEKGIGRFHSHSPAPRIDPWISPFERYSNAYNWNEWWKKVMRWPTTLWPELSTLFNLVVSVDFRDMVFNEMKDHMPFKSGTSKSFFSVNRKSGVVTIPFPTRYKIVNDYPRLTGYSEEMYKEDIEIQSKGLSEKEKKRLRPKYRPCSTLISADKRYKNIIVKFLNHGLEKHGFALYEWDLAACHTKILVSLFPEQTPIIRRVLENDESIWDEFSRSFPEEIIEDIGGRSVLKAWSKIVAYKCLQGGSVSQEGIKASLDPKGLKNIDPSKQEIILDCFAKNPVLREFNTLNQTLQDRRYVCRHLVDNRLQVYHPTSLKPIVLTENDIQRPCRGDTENMCRIASQVVVGGENWVLMLALEAIRSNKIPVIPIAFEYDGFLILSKIDKAEASLNKLNKAMGPLLKQGNLFPMNFEQK